MKNKETLDELIDAYISWRAYQTRECIENDYRYNKLLKELERLEKLEAIEEEIEISLTALFDIYKKLCEKKFVYMKIGHQIKCFYYDYFLIDFKNKEIIGMEYEPDVWLAFKDYGIVWALSREGLE